MLTKDFNFTKLLIHNLHERAKVDSYSGRCMYGKQCLSLSGSHTEVNLTISQALVELHETIVDTELNNMESLTDEHVEYVKVPDFEYICSKLLDYRQDQLGRDIVVYWPDIKFVDDGPSGPNDGEDDDEEYDEGATRHG